MIKLINDTYKNIEIPKNAIIVIDPPFNIGYHYSNYKDRKKEDVYFTELADLIRDRQAVIIHYPEALHKLSIKLGYAPIRVVSWVYNSNTGRQHRDIAFYNIKPNFKQVIQPYKNLNDKRIKERISRGIVGGGLYDWFNVNQVKNVSKKGITHPCIMPTKVMENIVGVLPKGSLIVDCFMGSGTTGIACKKLGYDFIGIEIDKTYYEEARKRINDYIEKEIL